MSNHFNTNENKAGGDILISDQVNKRILPGNKEQWNKYARK